MKRFVTSLLLVLAVLVLRESVSRADCGFELIVKNKGTTDVLVGKISTSITFPQIYKKQWEGSRVVAAGASYTFSFSVNTCPSSKSRYTKVWFQKNSSAVYEDVERHATGGTQEVQ